VLSDNKQQAKRGIFETLYFDTVATVQAFLEEHSSEGMHSPTQPGIGTGTHSEFKLVVAGS
jgi:hypothetical protein